MCRGGSFLLIILCRFAQRRLCFLFTCRWAIASVLRLVALFIPLLTRRTPPLMLGKTKGPPDFIPCQPSLAPLYIKSVKKPPPDLVFRYEMCQTATSQVLLECNARTVLPSPNLVNSPAVSTTLRFDNVQLFIAYRNMKGFEILTSISSATKIDFS